MNRQWFHNRPLVRSAGPETGERDFIPRRRFGALSPREQAVLGLMAKGLTDKQIGAALFISWKTVKTHRAHIFQKINVANRTQATLWWLANGG